MSERRFKVRVFKQAAKRGEPGSEELARAFTVTASNPDKARTLATARLEENRFDVVSVQHGPDSTIVATVAREPRQGPPTTLVANAPRAPRRLGGAR